jgi:hypothetical protein
MDDFKGWMLRHKFKSEGPTQEVCNIYIYINNSLSIFSLYMRIQTRFGK